MGDAETYTLAALLEQEFGRQLRLPPIPALRPFPSDAGPPSLFGSPVAVNNRQYLIQGDIQDFLNEAPDGYVLAGFWATGSTATPSTSAR